MSDSTLPKDCPFCKRINAREYDNTAYGQVVSFEPLNPVVPGHRLFVPRPHVSTPGERPGAAGAALMAAADYAYEQGLAYNLIFNAGEAATQSVWHMHLHYVPRRPDDGLHLPWTGQHG